MTATEGQHTEKAAPRMELNILDQGIRAELVLRGAGDPTVNYERIVEIMDNYRIVYGLDSSSINRLVNEYREGAAKGGEIRADVARGTPPKPPKDGKVDVLIEEEEKVSFDEDGRADYRNIHRFRTVKPGQVLARVIPPEPGEPGIDVHGQAINPPEPRKPDIEPGPNVRLSSDGRELIASMQGIFVQARGRIDVNPVLQIPGNVGLESGNVDYEGNVQIGGNVERASVVSAVGDVVVAGIIESGDIHTGGRLIAKKGINTKKEGMITVAGNLHAGYVENSNVTVEGSMEIYRSLIQSKVICYGDINLTGPGSTLTGGEVIVLGSVEAATLGNKTEIPTRLMIGLHYKNTQYLQIHQKELKDVERRFEKRAEAVERIKVFVQRARNNIPPAKKAEFRVIFNDYKETQELLQRLQAQVKDLLVHRYNREEVRVIARDVIHPGVEIHYRGHVEKIRAPLTQVVLRFRPDQEKPDIEAYKKVGR